MFKNRTFVFVQIARARIHYIKNRTWSNKEKTNRWIIQYARTNRLENLPYRSFVLFVLSLVIHLSSPCVYFYQFYFRTAYTIRSICVNDENNNASENWRSRNDPRLCACLCVCVCVCVFCVYVLRVYRDTRTSCELEARRQSCRAFLPSSARGQLENNSRESVDMLLIPLVALCSALKFKVYTCYAFSFFFFVERRSSRGKGNLTCANNITG